MLRLRETTIYLVVSRVEFIREVGKVLADIVTCFVPFHIVVIEVPVEVGLALALKGCEKTLLDALQEVESYEQIDIIFKVDLLTLNHLAI